MSRPSNQLERRSVKTILITASDSKQRRCTDCQGIASGPGYSITRDRDSLLIIPGPITHHYSEQRSSR